MAEECGIFAAKTRFSEIVERVRATGQPITVTNRGVPVVEIVPCRRSHDHPVSKTDAVQEIATLRTSFPPIDKAAIRDLIAEGRR
jgi:prevent-host-death family protein